MDHLPPPRSPRYTPPDIVCFVRADFACPSALSFEDYPESRGWKHGAFIDGDFRQGHTVKESQEFIQEWLYFEFMEAVFGSAGVEIHMDDFTRRKDGQLLVDSTNLIRYISAFEDQFRNQDSQAKHESVKRINRVLTTTQRLVVRECSMITPTEVRSGSWPFDLVTSLSFMVLGCTLAFAISRIVQVLPDKDLALELCKQLHISHQSWGVSEMLYERMRSDNWCPHSLAQFASGGYSIVGMYFASLLEIPSDGKDHTDCEVRECLHMTVDEKKYTTRHVHLQPCCEPSIPKRTAVIESLKLGSIPLLRISEADDGTISIGVVPFKDEIKYVAISHVWAHGLGNVEGNWLPSCQMRRLSQLAEALYPFSSARVEIYLWIDTVCVPRPNTTDDADYRKVAIDLLQDTYTNANKVLVIDDQLVRSSSTAPPEETLVRILSSVWMTRMWTLQEGLLAKKLRFQFKERALDVEDMLSGIMPIFHSSVWLEAHQFFTLLRSLQACTPGVKLRHLWNLLQWRSTSHLSDETICLSILTGKQPSKLLGHSKAGRMKAFLNQVDEVPSDIIFMPGPRLLEDGWKWAPTSFMARYQWTAYQHFQKIAIPGASDHSMTEQTNISGHFDKGLRVCFPGITLSDVPRNLDLIFRVETAFLKSKTRLTVVCWYDRCPPEWKDVDIKSLKHPTLILQAYPKAYGSIHAIFVDAYEGPGMDGIVEVDPTARSVTPTRFICRANVSVVEPRLEGDEEKVSYFQGDERVSRSCGGKLLDQQWWYVG
jgi:hypothetical protein